MECTGATVDYPPVGDEKRAFNGSCVVARASTKEEVLEEIKKDVYATAGVWNVDKVVMHPVGLLIQHRIFFTTSGLTNVAYDRFPQGNGGC